MFWCLCFTVDRNRIEILLFIADIGKSLTRTPSVCVSVKYEHTSSVFLLNHFPVSRFNHVLTCISVTVWLCMFPLPSSSNVSVVLSEALTTVGSLISSPHFKNPVTLYCFYTLVIVCMNLVACYIWMSACLFVNSVLIWLVLHVLASQNVNVCLHNHGLPPPPHRHCEHCSSWWESHNDLCVQFLPCLLWSSEGTSWAMIWPLTFQLLTRCCFLSSMASFTGSTAAKAPGLHRITGCVGIQTHSDAKRRSLYLFVFRKVRLQWESLGPLLSSWWVCLCTNIQPATSVSFCSLQRDSSCLFIPACIIMWGGGVNRRNLKLWS